MVLKGHRLITLLLGGNYHNKNKKKVLACSVSTTVDGKSREQLVNPALSQKWPLKQCFNIMLCQLEKKSIQAVKTSEH